MKRISSLLLLTAIAALAALTTLSAGAQLTNLSFGWFPSPNATGYRFYGYNGTNPVFLAATVTNRFTVTNWDLSLPRTVGVSATNMLMETSQSKLDVPPAPTTPQNFAPIPLSIVTPVPGVLEMSQDLVDWKQRVKLSPTSNPTNVLVTWVQYPREAVWFMRTKTASVPAAAPLRPVR